MDPILTRFVREPHAYTLDSYLKQQGGYEGLRKALAMTPGRGHRHGQALGPARARRAPASRPA